MFSQAKVLTLCLFLPTYHSILIDVSLSSFTVISLFSFQGSYPELFPCLRSVPFAVFCDSFAIITGLLSFVNTFLKSFLKIFKNGVLNPLKPL